MSKQEFQVGDIVQHKRLNLSFEVDKITGNLLNARDKRGGFAVHCDNCRLVARKSGKAPTRRAQR